MEPRPKYDECSMEQKDIFNAVWEYKYDNLTEHIDYKSMTKMAKVACDKLPKRYAKQNKRGISEKLKTLLDRKTITTLDGSHDGTEELKKQIIKQKKAEKQNTH